MSREARMVPAGWQHPRDESDRFIPLLDGSWESADKDWHEAYAMWQKGLRKNYGSGEWVPDEDAPNPQAFIEWEGEPPNPAEYMPTFPEGTATHLMMYETCTEGTPISPAFATPEELAHWLADTNASAFGGTGASYEGWLRVAQGGYAPSMVMADGVITSGVDAFAKEAS